MTDLEVLGMKALLAQTVDHLKRAGFDDVIGNGNYCYACGRSGGGTIAKHASSCSGVALLRTIERVLGIAPSGKEITEEPADPLACALEKRGR